MYKMYTHDGPGSHWPGPKGPGPPIMCVILYILHNVYIICTSYFNNVFNLFIYVFIFINIYVVPFIYSYTYSFKASSPPTNSPLASVELASRLSPPSNSPLASVEWP